MGKRRKVSRNSIFYSGNRKKDSGIGRVLLLWLLLRIEPVPLGTWHSALPNLHCLKQFPGTIFMALKLSA